RSGRRADEQAHEADGKGSQTESGKKAEAGRGETPKTGGTGEGCPAEKAGGGAVFPFQLVQHDERHGSGEDSEGGEGH
ncbi:MAG: hypothetical protein IJI08_07795, partial [Clostridia bacterium]|nr:hypothetical protein [Clostridia bacterium]